MGILAVAGRRWWYWPATPPPLCWCCWCIACICWPGKKIGVALELLVGTAHIRILRREVRSWRAINLRASSIDWVPKMERCEEMVDVAGG